MSHVLPRSPLCICAAALLLAACTAAAPDGSSSTAASPHGAGLFSWKGYVYAVGGVDADGAYRGEVWRAPLSSNGAVGTWTRDADLPEDLAYSSCAAFGGMAYVMGGRSSSGPSSTVYFALISSTDGSLGFSDGWETNPQPLPEARSGAAAVIHQGRVFLVGGETADGVTSSVISARFWNDGQAGQWYETPAALPALGSGFAAAVRDGELWVAGGGAAAAYHAGFDANGMPGAWSTASLDGARAYPALASTADGLLLFGGVDVLTGGNAATWTFDGSAWTSSAAVSCFGPHCVAAADRAFALDSVSGTDAPCVASAGVSASRADAPRVSPADGLIPAGTRPKVAVLPGDTVRYETAAIGSAPRTPTAASPEWDTASPPAVSGSAAYAFRAFRAGSDPSETVSVSYSVRSAATFLLLQGSITPQSGAGSLYTCSLTETYSDGSSSAVGSAWYSVTVAERSTLGIQWADAGTDPSRYDASVCVSLMEGDTYTPSRAADGTEMYRMTGSGARRVTLNPGTYYLCVESANGGTGGAFGLCVVKE